MFGENENDKHAFGGCTTNDQSNVTDDNQNEIFSSQSNDQNTFGSPVIPHIVQPSLAPALKFGGVFTSIIQPDSNERLDKSHWICDYSDDIFNTLRETELKRRSVWFRSQQVVYRPMLLQLLKDAAEKHKLARTTLHLAVYLLDCFMDNYTIRSDKINLTAITCLIVAAKIEETDTDMPRFSDLNKLVHNAYNLQEFKNVECKVLVTFNFDLIRPTAATFAEYFANSIITLQDYYMFVNPWNNELALSHHYSITYSNQQLRESRHNSRPPTPHTVLSISSCPYNSYEDMLTALNNTLFALVDVSLNSLKFANARPSIIASSCIAATRQIHGIFPIWTPYLIQLTACTADIIAPFVEAILAIYPLYCNDTLQYYQTPNTPVANGALNNSNILCDSPDSGIVSENDTKSMKSYTDDDVDDCENGADDSDEEEDEPYRCLEYPLTKRRRLF